MLRRKLAAGVVDGVVHVVFPGENQLGDGDEGVASCSRVSEDGGQGLGGMEGGVVEENDGPGLDPAHHPLRDLPGGRSFQSRLSTSHWMGSIPMERMDVITLLSYSP